MNVKQANQKTTLVEILLFLLAALAVRLWWSAQTQIPDYDGMNWISFTRLLMEGWPPKSINGLVVNSHAGIPAFPPYYGMVYPFLIAKLAWISNDLLQIAEGLSVVFGTLTVWPAFLFADRVFGRRTARLAAALLVFYPPLVEISGDVIVEPIYVFVFTMALLAFWQARESGHWLRWALAGLALGVLALVRMEGVLFIALFGAAGLWLNRRLGARRAAFLAAAMAIGFCLAALPYWLYLNQRWKDRVIGPYFSMRIGVEAYYNSHTLNEFLERLWRLEPDGKSYRIYEDERNFTEFGFLKRHWKQMAAGYPYQVGMEWAILKKFFAFPLLVVGAIYGLLGHSWRRKETEGFALFAAMPFLGLLQYPLFPWWPHYLIETRYLTYILPFLVILFAFGVVRLLEEAWPGAAKAGGELTRFGKFAAAAGFVFYVCWAIPYVPFISDQDEAIEFKKMGEWMARSLEPDAVVMTSHPLDVFYANRGWICTPWANKDQILEFGKMQGAGYVSVNARWSSARPQLDEWLDETQQHAGLDFVHSESVGLNRKVVLYRIEGASPKDCHYLPDTGERVCK